MRIPVCSVYQQSCVPCGTVFYDTESNTFVDEHIETNRTLPRQDLSSGEVISRRQCTVVGRCGSKLYVVSFGDKLLFILPKESLLKYSISNMKLGKDDRLICLDGRLPNLGYLFSDRALSLVSRFDGHNTSALGTVRKFFGYWKDTPCVVKFETDKKRRNEVLYNYAGLLFKVPVCPVIESLYAGKWSIVSLYMYDTANDVFITFRQTGKSVENVYKSLDRENKRIFDRMMVFDYLMSQEDRDTSNIALCNGKMYPLYGNGNCLGAGTIGQASMKFRSYVERLDANYIKDIMEISFPADKLGRVHAIMKEEEFKIFIDNCRRLKLCQ